MSEIERQLLAYETDVRFPDVSGMEHLDMLLTRSKIENDQNKLTNEQRIRLAEADQALLKQADLFYEAITSMADIIKWREHAEAPPTHWWWYLDVLANVPVTQDQRTATESLLVAAA